MNETILLGFFYSADFLFNSAVKIQRENYEITTLAQLTSAAFYHRLKF